ncbi:MAG: polysaccharide biosynthesis tyrosine autokinase [Candidatus Dormibacteria bacterium]
MALTVVGAIVAFATSKVMTSLYTAKGEVLVVAGVGQSGNNSSADVNVNATEATTTAATLLTSPPLLHGVIDAQHLNESVSTLAGNVAAAPEINSELVALSVTDPSSTRAAMIDNAIMNAFVAQITKQNTDRVNQASVALQAQIAQVQTALQLDEQQLATANAQSATALRQNIADETALLTPLELNYSAFRATQEQNLSTVSVATAASEPTKASSPKVLLNTGVGALAGLLLGLAMVALLEYLDQGLKSADDVSERLGLPCLALVPRHPATDGRPQPADKVAGVNEAYRRLRTNLLFAMPDSKLRSIVVTSVRSGEGKTQTAANLAVSMASTEKHVLLIDGDMRRPDLHRIFNHPLRGGMSELIVSVEPGQSLSLNGAHKTWQPNLTLITSGTIPPNPSELLSSERASLLLKALERQYDVTVIDTPPLDAVSDALTLAAEASGTVIVLEAGRTNVADATKTINALRGVGANILGVVLNKAREHQSSDYYYYYQDHEADGPAPHAVASPSTLTHPVATSNGLDRH